MSIAAKEPRKRLRKAIEGLDIPVALAALEEMKTDEVEAVLNEKMRQDGAYQVQGNRTTRNAFYDALLNSPIMLDRHASLCPSANKINEKIKIIESCFDTIRDSLPKCDISQFPEDIQFWSHIVRASRELDELDRDFSNEFAKIRASVLAGRPVKFSEVPIVQRADGETVNADETYENIVQTLSLILKMLSYERGRIHDGKLEVPAMPPITDQHVYKAGSLHLYAGSWNALKDAANRVLFFDGAVSEVQVEELLDEFPEQIGFHSWATDIEVYDFIANRRLHSWMMQLSFDVMQHASKNQVSMKKGVMVPDLVGECISTEEYATLLVLSEILAYDILTERERFHGLTLREWVRGYHALRLMAAAKQKETCLVVFERTDIEKGLRDYNLPEECIHPLICHLTFGKDSRDLYDTPLICSEDGKYTLLVSVLKACNVAKVLLSRLSSLNTQLGKKGKGFESLVVSKFKRWGYPCQSTKFKIDDAVYEYDALVLIDDTLLLIECKNNVLSMNNSVQTFYYYNSLRKNVEQTKRLERGLRDRPEIIEELFGRKLNELTLVPVVLNCMTYSREPVEGVYIVDWSALSRFFERGVVGVSVWGGGKEVGYKISKKLWEGERPTEKCLIDYLAMPIQVQLVRDYLFTVYLPHPMSERSIFISRRLCIAEERRDSDLYELCS
jgi:hypothetical protein